MTEEYRVTTISEQPIGNVENHYPVLTLHEAKTVIEAWSNAELSNKEVSSNEAFVEKYDSGTKSWWGWRDNEGLGYDETEQVDFVVPGTKPGDVLGNLVSRY